MVISVDMPDGLEREVEDEVDRGRYKSKSELVRDAIRRLLEKQRVDERLSEEMQKRLDDARESEKRIPHSEIQ